MHKFRIIMRNGTDFIVDSEHFSVYKTCGKITGYEIEGLHEKNYPLYINIEQIDAIIQLE